MTHISSRLTPVLKLGPWLLYSGPAFWLLFSIPDGSSIGSIIRDWWWVILILVFGSVFHYFTHWQLVDEVLDEGHQLAIRRGHVQVEVPLKDVAGVREGMPLFGNLQGRKEVIVELSQRTRLGKRIHFAPASPSRLPHTHRRTGLVIHLGLRAQRARTNAA